MSYSRQSYIVRYIETECLVYGTLSVAIIRRRRRIATVYLYNGNGM